MGKVNLTKISDSVRTNYYKKKIISTMLIKLI